MPESELFEHFVQFYEADPALSDSLTSFIGAGLSAGDASALWRGDRRGTSRKAGTGKTPLGM